MNTHRAISYQNCHKQGILPRDLFGWILLFFIIGTMALSGQNQLKMIGVLLAGCYTLYFLKEKEWIPTEFIVYFYWLIWSCTGFAVSVGKELFLHDMMLVFQIAVMSFAIAGITARRGDLNTNFFALGIGGIILFVLSMISSELQFAAESGAETRVQGIAQNSNYYGYLMLMSVAAALFFWGNNVSRVKRMIIILLITVFCIGIIFSGSRKAFAALIVLILMWLFMCYGKELLKRPSYFIAVMLVSVGLYFVTVYMVSNTFMGERFQEDLVENPITKRTNSYKRIVYYKEGFKMIKKNPIFGVGLGNFRYHSHIGGVPHSDYIEVAASTGIIGFLLYFSIYVLLWCRLSRIQKQINNPSILYNIGLFKAIIITILIIALGRPHFNSQLTWIILSSFIGYSWGLERKIIYLTNHQKL